MKRTLIVLVTIAFIGMLVMPGCFMLSDDDQNTQDSPLSNIADALASLTTQGTSPEESCDGIYGGYENSAEYLDLDFNYNTEEYDWVDESPFYASSVKPLSTVSADADTASYTNLRRMVANDVYIHDIPAGAIRTEELLNYFDYSYPEPDDDGLFGTSVEIAPCPWNEETQLLVMGFQTVRTAPGREGYTDASAETAGNNLVFLVDVSGSMSEFEKLPLLQQSFATLVENLNENDRVSIVTYSSGEKVVLEGAHGSDRQEIMAAIDSLDAGGSTNGESGLRTAYRVAADNYIEGGVNRIVLASDGDLNVGMTSTSDLHDFVETKRATGIYLSVLGFGSGNYKDNKMETLADHGNGSYHYIDCVEEAERVLGRNLCANMVPLANDIKIQVEFNPATVKGWRLIGYENREMADEDFDDESADAGEIGTGNAFTVAYELAPAGSHFEAYEPDLKYGATTDYTGNGTGEFATCTVRYRDAWSDEAAEQQVVVGESVVNDGSSATINGSFATTNGSLAITEAPSANWKLAASLIECSMILRDSDYKGTSTFESALSLAEEAQAELLDHNDLDQLEDCKGYVSLLRGLM